MNSAEDRHKVTEHRCKGSCHNGCCILLKPHRETKKVARVEGKKQSRLHRPLVFRPAAGVKSRARSAPSLVKSPFETPQRTKGLRRGKCPRLRDRHRVTITRSLGAARGGGGEALVRLGCPTRRQHPSSCQVTKRVIGSSNATSGSPPGPRRLSAPASRPARPERFRAGPRPSSPAQLPARAQAVAVLEGLGAHRGADLCQQPAGLWRRRRPARHAQTPAGPARA